ncbi:MAG TPA: GyrI-like domain-containing protein [Coxiellaceae bacterium]|nr:MAG: hypothetical protein A3E81_07375 [Gammaproteobacteria bacterium RIFCSPHIGHO2_12_FULL_36_30]HLB57158.1 GyrI-like domain-containing protein [Coxiellaceae bacterium]
MASHVEQTYQERILKVLVHIQNHLDDELSLEELASVAYFSPFHFHRIFTALTGESIKSYVRRLRLERATRDLVFTDLSIVQVGERAGYDTQQSFHRAFKEAFNETPKTFREKATEGLSLRAKQNELDANAKELVIVKTIEPIVVAFVRHVGPYDHGTIMKSWMQLVAEVGLPHILSDKSEKISIPYDSPETTLAEKLRYDACVTVDQLPNFKAKGAIGVQTIEGGKYAVITHNGSLDTIENAYNILFGVWLPQSGYEPADHPNFMLHRKIPFQISSEDLVTDIYLPLK